MAGGPLEDLAWRKLSDEFPELLTEERLLQEIARNRQVVMSENFKSALRDLLSILVERRAVLVEGPGGCGKTVLVNSLINGVSHVCECITIFMGEQVDSKVLVGTFVCTGTPGDFVWKPGVLASAILSKKWILIEDIDRAPPDVVSLLIPLVKYGTLLLPGYKDPLRAADSFRLIATRRLSPTGSTVSPSSRLFEVLENKFFKISITPLGRNVIIEIISELFPNLKNFAPNLIKLQEQVNLEMRCLFKLCNRLSTIVSSDGYLCSVEDAVLECLDVSFGGECRAALNQHISVVVQVFQNISSEKVQYLWSDRKPSIQIGETCMSVGRAYLTSSEESINRNAPVGKLPYAHTQQSLYLLERVTRCIQMKEPVLLVGETGVGKTAALSYLSQVTGHKLVVVNMSQQSDSSDLLGGFKPVDVGVLIKPLRETFEFLFRRTFSVKQNTEFLGYIQSTFMSGKWKTLLKLMIHSAKAGVGKASSNLTEDWEELLTKLKRVFEQLSKAEGTMAFSFVEGSLVQAMTQGWWILLDEINLAAPETLQCLSSLIESSEGTFPLIDRGDTECVRRSEEFRIFGCMNPATDHGKAPLPPHIRNRFTEFYVEEMTTQEDLRQLIHSYLPGTDLPLDISDSVIKFYREIKKLSEDRLSDGMGRKPHFSLRTLCRALRFASSLHCSNIARSLYEGLCMSFVSQVTRDQHCIVESVCQKHLNLSSDVIRAPLPHPKSAGWVKVEGYWVEAGSLAPATPPGYVLTPSVRDNLAKLSRIISGSRFPVLLQGHTSSGKTSLIRWLAEVTGHKCIRINNHEHTDIQEYIGLYTADHLGKLVFREGVLVEAMRQGYWVILDELNLAPTEVLEALNRVLDDNRELFITETHTLVKAHPHFMLFGTQNPPGAYGGRKFLSRAFRNRFIELHFEEIPANELINILYEKCGIPESYAKKMVAVMQDLQCHRTTSGVFAGKHGLITLRDLFKWANRYSKMDAKDTFNDWEQVLAEDGYLILAGRARKQGDEEAIVGVLRTHFKRTVNPESVFGWNSVEGTLVSGPILSEVINHKCEEFAHIVWTREMKRLAVLVGRAIQFSEPILLVGETGCGKTTICQLMCCLSKRKMYSINCHMYTEASDFLGGLRPARHGKEGEEVSRLFEWQDGVLVQAMSEGAALLIDEISLAEDAVLERLNSVLEPECKVLVAERGNELGVAYEVTAKRGFCLLSTMNPGGDYGKRELSPALRNRFTELWCPSSTSVCSSLKLIAQHNLLKEKVMESVSWDTAIIEFIEWLQKQQKYKPVTSIRDLMCWIHFINATVSSGALLPREACYHGACLVFLDPLPIDTQQYHMLYCAAQSCLKGILVQLQVPLEEGEVATPLSREDSFGIHPFYIPRGPGSADTEVSYNLEADGPKGNAFRILRALQISKPLLLEGPPGVGKTSLVSALARSSGHTLTRICLSEQTDLSELFGSDLPDETSASVRFVWRDGPFLRALKCGEWIVLDEMNLASQAVLEGLNACFDHRGEVYLPALDRSFTVSKKTRIFACQNPVSQGGGRKQLPKSFLNRFSRVYMKALAPRDLLMITHSLYPAIEKDLVARMIHFNMKVSSVVDVEKIWEFNLRDVIRWCQLMVTHQKPGPWDPGQFVGILYLQRMRNKKMIPHILELFCKCFSPKVYSPPHWTSLSTFHLSPSLLTVSRMSVKRENHFFNKFNDSLTLQTADLPYMEALLTCIRMKWMAILTGPSKSGKSSLVHSLAQLTGNKVLEFPMNSSMDTTDLVGCYVQANVNRHFVNMASCVKDILSEGLMCILKESTVAVAAGSYLEYLQQWRQMLSKVEDLVTELIAAKSQLTEEDVQSHLTTLKGALEDVTSLDRFNNSKVLLDKVDSIRCQLDGYSHSQSPSQFEWVDSLLVTALREGHWLVITNANFCSPSVLDRLNALLEPGGVLTLDERGVVGGEIPVIIPHANFRLFLTMDAKYGELSHAMRNRGIELYIARRSTKDVVAMATETTEIVKSTSSPVNAWAVDPISTAAKWQLQPVLTLLPAQGGSTLQELTTQLEVYCGMCYLYDADIRLKLVEGLVEEANPTISMTLQEGLVYLRELRDLLLESPFSEAVGSVCQQLFDPKIDSYTYHNLELHMNLSDKEVYCRFVNRCQLAAKMSALSFKVSKLSEVGMSEKGGLTLLQTSRAAASGTISVMSLENRNIVKLWKVLQNTFDLLCSLSREGSLEIEHEQVHLICSSLSVIVGHSSSLGGDWPLVAVGWSNLWKTVTELLSNQAFGNTLNSSEWTSVSDFSNCVSAILSGPLFWLRIWTSLNLKRLNITFHQATILNELIRVGAPICQSQDGPYWIVPKDTRDQLECVSSMQADLWTDVLRSEGVAVDMSTLHARLKAVQWKNLEEEAMSSSENAASSSSPLLIQACALLAAKQVILKLLQHDFQSVHRLCTKLSQYLNGTALPVKLRALINSLAACQGDAAALWKGLPLLWMSCISELVLNQYSHKKTVNMELMEYLADGHISHHGEGGVGKMRQWTVGNVEEIKEDIKCLQHHLWSSSLMGATSTECHCEMVYKIGLAQYNWILGGLENILSSTGRKNDVTAGDPVANGNQLCAPFEYLNLNPGDDLPEVISTSVKLLSSSFSVLANLSSVRSSAVDFYKATASLNVYNGLALTAILLPSAEMDPFEVAAAERSVNNEMVKVLEMRLKALERYFDIVTNKLCIDTHSKFYFKNWIPECVKDLKSCIRRLKGNHQSMSEHMTGNGTPEQRQMYQRLASQCHQISQDLCSKDRVLVILKNLTGHEKDSLEQAQGWSTSVIHALESLNAEYSTFLDVFLPWALGAYQIVEGILQLMVYSRDQSLETSPVVRPGVRLVCPDWEDPSLSDALCKVKHIVSLARSSDSWSRKKRLVMAGVKLVSDHASLVKGCISTGFQEVSSSLFGVAADLWRKADEREREKEKEDESLFKYKERTHCFEEETHEHFIEKLFPSFDSDFDFVADDNEMEVEPNSSLSTDNQPLQFTAPEMHAIYQCNIPICITSNVPLRNSFEDLYNMAASFSNSAQLPIFCGEEEYLIEAHLMKTLKILRLNTGCHGDGAVSSKNSVMLNVYEDFYPKEYAKAKLIIEAIVKTSNVYLQQWPDHPVLNQIIASCNHVILLPMKSPLMKVLTGCEYILKQTQQWEMYASSQVSLSTEISSLVELILAWRRLELRCWEVLMDMQARQWAESSGKWWFHLYHTLQVTPETESAIASIPGILQTFVQMSCLGDFVEKVKLLHLFSQCTFVDNAVKTVLHNLYNFYIQFAVFVENEIHKQREPLEREFKDYLSVLRWNDGNYWAIKEGIRKNHSAVANLIKKFKDVLSEPVGPLLQTAIPQQMRRDSHFTTDWISRMLKMLQLPHRSGQGTVLPHIDSPDLRVRIGDGSCSLPDLYQQLERQTTSLRSNNAVSRLLLCLEQACIEVSETTEELVKEVDLSKVSEEKKKAAVKLHLQLKRRVLSDLFKYLAESGFSFRRGRREAAMFASELVHIPSLSCGKVISQEISDSTNALYYSTAAKMVALQSCLSKPEKGLAVGELERIDGLVGAFALLLQKQRALLSSTAEQLASLSSVKEELIFSPQASSDGLHTVKSTVLLSKDTVTKEKDLLVATLENALQVISGVEELVHSLTEPVCDNLWLLEQEQPKCLTASVQGLAKPHLESLKNCAHELQKCLSEAVLNEKRNSYCEVTSANTWKRLCDVSSHHLSHLQTALRNMLSVLLDPKPPRYGPFYNCIKFIETLSKTLPRLNKSLDLLSHPYSGFQETDVELQSLSLQLVRSVLSSVQSLVKVPKAPPEVNITGPQEDEPISPQLLKSSYSVPFECVSSLASDKVCQSLTKLCKFLGRKDEIFTVPSSYVTMVTSFVDQYTLMLKDSLSQLSLSHYGTCQYLSILLRSFLQLVQKGFGLPNLEEESSEGQEGATEFVDMEAEGFDEGQGTENVSKDNQDLKELLENASERPGDEPSEQKDSLNERDVNAIEMDFNFDGHFEDVPDNNGDNPDINEEEEPEEDLNEKMGDLGNDTGEILDKDIWAPEEEEKDEDELQEVSDVKAEGSDIKKDAEIVAKDSNRIGAENADTETSENTSKEKEPDLLEDHEEEADESCAETYNSDGEDLNSKIDEAEDTHFDQEEDGADLESDSDVEGTGSSPESEEEAISKEDVAPSLPQPCEESDMNEMKRDEPEVSDYEQRGCIQEDLVTDAQKFPNTSTSVPQFDLTEVARVGDQDGKETTHTKERGYQGNSISDQVMNSEKKRGSPKRRRPAVDRALLPPSSAPEAKRLKAVDSTTLEDQSEEEEEKAKSLELYSHMRDAERWDEEVIDVGTTDQQYSGIPVQEDLGEEQSDSEDDAHNTKEMDTSFREAQSFLLNEHPLKQNTTEEDMLMEKDNTDSEIEIESEDSEIELELDTDNQSFYHFDPTHFQESSNTVAKSTEELQKMVEESTLLLHQGEEVTVDACDLWSKYELVTAELAQMLFETIKITFEPSLATQFRGDYKSGKRLNIRRLIPYIASHYQNDRIWLRRSKPSRMNYQILVAIDDSSSMMENKCKLTAFKSLAVLSGALNRLEGVSFGICRFGEEVDLLKDFDEYMNSEAGAFVLQHLTFQQKKTNFVKLLSHSLALFEGRSRTAAWRSAARLNQLLIVLSDGRGVFMEGVQAIEKSMRELSEAGIFSVFIILDPLQKDSVLSIKIPIFHSRRPPTFKSYLEVFPFPYYIILKHIDSLPIILGESLQQWFQLINNL